MLGYMKNCDAFSVEVVTTAREEENHEMEVEQLFPKTKGKRIKTVASIKKK